jgi:hypothetical protein
VTRSSDVTRLLRHATNPQIRDVAGQADGPVDPCPRFLDVRAAKPQHANSSSCVRRARRSKKPRRPSQTPPDCSLTSPGGPTRPALIDLERVLDA